MEKHYNKPATNQAAPKGQPSSSPCKGQGAGEGPGVRAFLLAKPTQFDTPFFQWWANHHPEKPFQVFYWQPVGTAADTDTETGASLNWGIPLLEGYPWQQVDPAQPLAFGSLLQLLGVTYLVSNGWKQGFAPLLQAARQAGMATGLRIDSVVWNKSPVELIIRRVVLQKAYRQFNHFFSSGTVGDQFLKRIGIPPQQWRRWPYMVDPAFFAPSPAHTSAAAQLQQQYQLSALPVVLGVCKWNDRENPLELLQAFVQLLPNMAQLVLIGDGPLRPQVEAIQKKYPRHQIVFPGYVPYVQLPHWYALADVFVHPARYEPWGVSVQEALLAGCTVVASNRVGSGYDFIRTGENGYTYPVGNLTALQAALQKALQHQKQVLPINPAFCYAEVWMQL